MRSKPAHVKNEEQGEALKEKGMSKGRATGVVNSRASSSRAAAKS